MDNYTAIGYLEGLRRMHDGLGAEYRELTKALEMGIKALAAEQVKLDEAEDAEYRYVD